MSKFGKLIAGTGLFLAISGGLLSLAGSAMGAEKSLDVHWGRYSFQLTPYGVRDGAMHGGESVVEDLALEKFHSVDIDVSLADVTIERGSDYGVDLNWRGGDYQLHYSNENGVLKVWDSGADYNFRSNFFASAAIYLPSGVSLTDVNMNLSMGDADVYDLTADRVTVDCEMGSATLDGLTAQVVDLELDMGSIDMTDTTVSETLTAKVAMGGASLYGDLACDMDLTADMGNVTVGTERPASDYSCALETDMGSITVDGEEYRHHYNGGNGPHTLKANSGMGSVDLYFDD